MADTRLWDGGAADNNIATAANWSADTAPITGDSAGFPALDAAAALDVDGADFSAAALVDFIVEDNCFVNFGSRLTALKLDCDYFEFSGDGKYAYFDVINCAELRILGGGSAASGHSFGVSLLGSTNTLLIVDALAVTLGIAAGVGQSATFTTIQHLAGATTLGDAVTCTNFIMSGGTVVNSTELSGTLSMYDGYFTQVRNNPATLTVRGGRCYYNSTDAPTTCNLYDGVLDLSKDGRAKTFATLNWYGGQIYDPRNILTVTTLNRYKGGTLTVN